MLDVQQPTDEADRDEEGGRRLATLVLDRETIRNLTPRGSWIEAIGKKKTKSGPECQPSTSWPTCGDTTEAKPKCPIETEPGTDIPTP